MNASQTYSTTQTIFSETGQIFLAKPQRVILTLSLCQAIEDHFYFHFDLWPIFLSVSDNFHFSVRITFPSKNNYSLKDKAIYYYLFQIFSNVFKYYWMLLNLYSIILNIIEYYGILLNIIQKN